MERSHTESERLAAGARGAEQQASEFKPQECANMAWASCSRERVGASQHSMGIGIGEQSGDKLLAERQASEFKPEESTNTAWAFATVNSRSSPKAAWA